jgi:hypothetical protein
MLLIANFFVGTSQAEIFFQDGFESGNLSHVDSSSNARWTDPNFGSGDSVSVTDEIAHTGTRSLRFVFGGDSSGSDAFAEQRFSLGSRMEGAYIRFYMRLPANFKVRADRPNNNKFIRLWGGSYSGNPGKLGASFITNSSHPSNIILEGSRCYESGSWYPDYSRCDYGDLLLNGSFVFTKEHLNRWLCIEYHLRNDTGAGDGALELWVDGQKVAGKNNINFRNDSDNNPGYFDTGYLLGWANSGFDENTVIYIDDVVFSDEYIGPSSVTGDEDVNPPGDATDLIHAPNNLRIVD